MADLDAILASLIGGGKTQETVAATDPYAPYAGLGNQILSTAFQAAPKASLRDKLLGSLVTGLVGGGIQGLSNNYQARATSAYNDAVLNKPGADDVLADLDPRLLSSAQGARTLFDANKLITQQKANTDLQASLLEKYAGATDPDQRKAVADIINNLDGSGKIKIAVPIATSSDEESFSSLKSKFGESTANKIMETRAPALVTANEAKKAPEVAQAKADVGAINSLFDSIRDMENRPLGALGIPFTGVQTPQGTKLDQTKANLLLYMQKKLGTEPSDKARALADAFVPRSTDTNEQIDQKKVGFHELMTNLTKDPTAFMATSGLTTEGSPPLDTSPKYEVRTAPNGQRYKVILGQ